MKKNPIKEFRSLFQNVWNFLKNLARNVLDFVENRPFSFYGGLGLLLFGISLIVATYENIDSEIGAGLLQATATLGGVMMTIGFSFATFYANQRNAIRNEVYRKRLDLYNELYYRCKQVQEEVFASRDDIEQYKESINELRDYIEKNRFFLSEKVYSLTISFLSIAIRLRGYFVRDAYTAMSKLLELPEEYEGDLFASLDEFYSNYYLPILRQMERELNLKPVQKDIENMYRNSFLRQSDDVF